MFSIGLLTISFLCTFIVPFANTVIFIKDGYLVSKTLLYTKNINLKEKFVCNKDKDHSNITTMIKQNKVFIFVFSSREVVPAEIAKKFTEVLEKYIE